ncbi:MAG: ABC transporter ATP-binding protein [Chloroflexi bacterium]|nr:ABC transporter ATP-binding protein [Chloroflexota bacterium]
MPAVYEVKHLTKVYREGAVVANDDVSLAIERGEIFGLLGENGAGKTTLVKQMMNLIAPTRGCILLEGDDISRTPHLVPLRVGYLAQRPYAIQDLTVGQAIFLTGHLRGLSRRDARQATEALIAEWRLGALRDRPIRKLSGGQLRLVGLATALVGGREILILDEPTNELDPANRFHVWEALRRRNREAGVTILLVTHNLLEAERVIQRVAIMRGGRMIAIGRPGELKARLGETVQIELTLVPGQNAGARLSALGLGDVRSAGAERWSLTTRKDDLGATITRLLDEVGSEAIEDLRLQTHSLEDVYLAFDHDGRHLAPSPLSTSSPLSASERGPGGEVRTPSPLSASDQLRNGGRGGEVRPGGEVR